LLGDGAHGLPATWLAVLVDAFIKGTLVLVAAGAVSVCLRRSSAASRRLVWSLGLAAVVLLPAFSLMLPAWQVPVLPSLTRTPAPALPDPGPTVLAPDRSPDELELSEVPEFGVAAAPTVPEATLCF